MDDFSGTSSAKEFPTEYRSSRPLVRRRYPTKSLNQQDVQDKLAFLRSFRHKNLVSMVETFHNEDSGEIESIFEFMPVDVVDLCVRGFPFIEELSLAAILGQASCDLSTLEFKDC